MWPRKTIDIDWADLFYGAFRCLWQGDTALQQREIEQSLGGEDHVLTCLSVRTAFDLLLQSLRLPPGSEVIMSAITIPDMITIVKEHGLIPVPLDLDFDTLAPLQADLQKAFSEKTRAIVIAHLFGVVLPMEPLVAFAKTHGIVLIEDCAQSFCGWDGISKSDADASLYSFGPIKTATSLGGAILRIRDEARLKSIRELQSQYPQHTGRTYAARVLKYSLLKAATTRIAYRGILWVIRIMGRDPDTTINSFAKNFGKGNLFERIRQRPCGALIAMMRRRIRTYRGSRISDRTRMGKELGLRLQSRIAIPGIRASHHSHWVFPVVADTSHSLASHLQRCGFDATTKHNLSLLEPPLDDRERDAPVLRNLFNNILFLPIYPELSPRAIQRLVDSIKPKGCPYKPEVHTPKLS